MITWPWTQNQSQWRCESALTWFSKSAQDVTAKCIKSEDGWMRLSQAIMPIENVFIKKKSGTALDLAPTTTGPLVASSDGSDTRFESWIWSLTFPGFVSIWRPAFEKLFWTSGAWFSQATTGMVGKLEKKKWIIIPSDGIDRDNLCFASITSAGKLRLKLV